MLEWPPLFHVFPLYWLLWQGQEKVSLAMNLSWLSSYNNISFSGSIAIPVALQSEAKWFVPSHTARRTQTLPNLYPHLSQVPDCSLILPPRQGLCQLAVRAMGRVLRASLGRLITSTGRPPIQLFCSLKSIFHLSKGYIPRELYSQHNGKIKTYLSEAC